jgi:hypothetical protein
MGSGYGDDAFPLIKLAKKLKDSGIRNCYRPHLSFPLIKLAKKLKEQVRQFFCLSDEKVSIN